MNQEEIIDRLRKVTGSWDATFRLLDKYETTGEFAACEPLKLDQKMPEQKSSGHAPSKAALLEKEVKFASKRVRIKRGTVPVQIKEILEIYPESTLPEIAKLGDWNFHDREHMTAGLSRSLKQMIDSKVIVRKKVDGLYSYRLAEKK